MKVQRTISLDERTAAIAGSINNLSEFVRARLLAFDEGVIDEFSEKLAHVPTRRLIAMTLARLGKEIRYASNPDEAAALMHAEGALLAVMLEESK